MSYGLWGDKKKYCEGAVFNARECRQFYPDFEARFYCGECVPLDYINEILREGATVYIVKIPATWRSTFWRFMAALETDVEHIIFRDCDSRLSEREAAAVEAWAISGKAIHIMRDHPFHMVPILAGMWGIKKGAIPDLLDRINMFDSEDTYGIDQKFLARIIFPEFKNDALVHDEFFDGVEFPVDRIGEGFVGEIYDENNIPESVGREIMSDWIRMKRWTPRLKVAVNW